MRHIPRVCGGVLLILGAMSILEALRLRDDWQGARLMPAVVGAVLVGLGVVHLVTPPGEVVESGARRRAVLLFALLALYVAALTPLGFLPATALFVLILVRALGAYSWPAAVALTVAIALASHVVFKQWLGMPLPAGPLGL